MINTSRNDAEFCGKVPLNQTNMVQPHGYLLVIEKSTLRILQTGENITDLLGRDAREVVQTNVTEYLPKAELEKIVNRFEKPVSGRLPFLLSFPNGQHLATVKARDSFFIIEVERERRNSDASNFIDIYQDLRYVTSALDAATTTEETCSIAIRELKRISGFDKIMVYRFDENWNGDVIAEEMEPGMESYFGLKFPASDVPKQARELYRTTPYRLIPNVDDVPVRLFPVLNPITGGFTDLADSNLRSVAPVHIEYLRNMKVCASMSTRILVNDSLWGLIACHHRKPKYLSFETCSLFELLSNLISAKISAMQNGDVYSYKTEMNGIHTQLVEDIHAGKNIMDGVAKNSLAVMNLLGAEGFAMVSNNRVEAFGRVPDSDAIEDLVMWLQSNNVQKLYHQPSLSKVYENAETYSDEASGIIALPVQPDRGSYILAFRPEAVSKVNWGGNPNEAVRFEADGKRYHPRASFQLWQEAVTRTSVPWRKEELEIAEQFRNFIVEYTLNKM